MRLKGMVYHSLPWSARSQCTLNFAAASALDVYIEEQILDRVREHPEISSRNLARETDVSKTTVLTVLHKNKFYPYHFTKVQGLKLNDYAAR